MNHKAVPLLDGAPPCVGEIEYGLSHAEDIDEAASESKVHRRLGCFTFRHFGLEQFSSGTDEIETTKRGGADVRSGRS